MCSLRTCSGASSLSFSLSLSSLLPRFFFLPPPPLSTLTSVTRAQGVVGARLTRISGQFLWHGGVAGPNACVSVSHHGDGMPGTACECVLITPLSLFVPRSLVSSPGHPELSLSLPLLFVFLSFLPPSLSFSLPLCICSIVFLSCSYRRASTLLVLSPLSSIRNLPLFSLN